METRSISSADFDYVVVGAGPVGLAAAGQLAKAGARVAVFDARTRPKYFLGAYPVLLNSRGIGALKSLGEHLPQRADEVGVTCNRLHIVANNRTVATIRAFGIGIMRDQVAQLLLEHAEAQPSIRFFWQHKLDSIDFSSRSCTFSAPDDVRVTIADIVHLVAADGCHSKVRRACAARVPGFHVQEEGWGFQLRCMTSPGTQEQTEVDPMVHYVLGDKGYVCQKPNNKWHFFLRVVPDVDEDFLTANEATEERVQQLRAYLEKCAGFAAKNLLDDEVCRDFYNGQTWEGVTVKCSVLNPGGWICLIGDAAHAVPPALGEGINSGLEDAAVLGAMVLEHPENPFGAFDARHRANAHALQVLGCQAREKVVGSKRTMVSSILVNICLSIAKKLRIIDGVMQDFMIGELAHTRGVKSYAELMGMEARQTRFLKPLAQGILKLLRVPDESQVGI